MVTVWVVSVKPVVTTGDGLAVDVGVLTGLLGGAAPALPGPFPTARRDAGPPSRPGIATIDRPTTMVREQATVAAFSQRLVFRSRGAWFMGIVRRSVTGGGNRSSQRLTGGWGRAGCSLSASCEDTGWGTCPYRRPPGRLPARHEGGLGRAG